MLLRKRQAAMKLKPVDTNAATHLIRNKRITTTDLFCIIDSFPRIVGQRTGSNPADCVILLCCWLGVHWEELRTVWIIAGI